MTGVISSCLILRAPRSNSEFADAQAAHAAARIINQSVEDLDSVRIRPLIEELVLKSDGSQVRDSVVSYWS